MYRLKRQHCRIAVAKMQPIYRLGKSKPKTYSLTLQKKKSTRKLRCKQTLESAKAVHYSKGLLHRRFNITIPYNILMNEMDPDRTSDFVLILYKSISGYLNPIKNDLHDKRKELSGVTEPICRLKQKHWRERAAKALQMMQTVGTYTTAS